MINRIPERNPVIGMAARFVTEKGVEVLLDALPIILKKYPKAQVLFAGQYRQVMGEQEYYDRLIPRILDYQTKGHWRYIPTLMC